jgi:hypothetical protein
VKPSCFDYSNLIDLTRSRLEDALDSMDVLSTPRRPHKSPAHTVKDLLLRCADLIDSSLPRPPNVSSEGAAYYTTIFESVNTFLKIFSQGFAGIQPFDFRQRRHSSKGGESYNRFPFRQHPGSKFFAS